MSDADLRRDEMIAAMGLVVTHGWPTGSTAGHSLEGLRDLYVRGDISVELFERAVGELLRAEERP